MLLSPSQYFDGGSTQQRPITIKFFFSNFVKLAMILSHMIYPRARESCESCAINVKLLPLTYVRNVSSSNRLSHDHFNSKLLTISRIERIRARFIHSSVFFSHFTFRLRLLLLSSRSAATICLSSDFMLSFELR